jgi:hypothetical protein
VRRRRVASKTKVAERDRRGGEEGTIPAMAGMIAIRALTEDNGSGGGA